MSLDKGGNWMIIMILCICFGTKFIRKILLGQIKQCYSLKPKSFCPSHINKSTQHSQLKTKPIEQLVTVVVLVIVSQNQVKCMRRAISNAVEYQGTLQSKLHAFSLQLPQAQSRIDSIATQGSTSQKTSPG